MQTRSSRTLAALRAQSHPLALTLAALALYISGLPESITWSHNAADGAELATAVVTWGVPHPPGYPAYVLIGKLFTLAPWGDPAHRLAFMSAVLAAGAVGLLWHLVREVQWLIPGPDAPPSPWPASLGAAALAVSPVFWSQAVVPEVYALNAFLFTGGLFMLAAWVRRCLYVPSNRRGPWWLAGAALLLGVGLGNHLTIAVLLPLLGAAALLGRQQGLVSRRNLAVMAGALLLGLGVYAYLPIAAAQHPPVNWGLAARPEGFIWTVTGTPYQQYVLGLPASALPERVLAWVRLVFVDQFTPLGAALGLLGAWRLLEQHRGLFWAGASVVAVVSVYAVTYDSADSFVFMVPAFAVMALWIALGAEWLLHLIATAFEHQGPSRVTTYSVAALAALFLAAPGVKLGAEYGDISLRGDAEALDYARAALASVEEDAVVLAESDEELFPLWYGRHVLELNPGATVVAARLLRYDWYVEDLRRRVPDLLPETLQPTSRGRILDLVAHALERRPVYLTTPDPLVTERYQTTEAGPLLRVGEPIEATDGE